MGGGGTHERCEELLLQDEWRSECVLLKQESGPCNSATFDQSVSCDGGGGKVLKLRNH